MRLSIIWRTDQGAFHVGKSSGSTGLNANETRGSTGNFSEQTDDPPSYSTFSVPTGWNRNSGSICAILFRPKAGTWTFFRLFQCLPVSDDHGLSQFFFSFLIVSFKMASVQNSCESLSGFKFLETKQQQTAAISTIGKKAFPFDPEGFRNFQSEIFPKWKAPRAPSWGLRLQITVIFETVHLSTKAWTLFHCVICMLVGSECSKGVLYRSRRCYLVKRSILSQAFR